MTRSLLNHHSVRQALAIGLGVLAVALVFGLLIYSAGGNTANANNAPPPDDPIPIAQLAQPNTNDPDPTATPTPEPEATATPTPTPELHPTPEPCPGTAGNIQETAEVVSEGRHAVFDVYWSSATVNLTTNPCPPSVIHTVVTPTPTPTPAGGSGSSENEEEDEDEDEPDPTPTPAPIIETSRAASNINLDTTVLHVPETTKQTLSDDSATDQAAYPFLYKDTDNDGTVDELIQGVEDFWVLPYCDVEDGYVWKAGDMCMGFSTGLLHEHHWLAVPGDDTGAHGKIHYEFESIRWPGIDYNDRGLAYVFLPRSKVTNLEDQVTWNTLDVDDNVMEMEPGTYEHRHWGFTAPGTYVFSVHAKGHPQSALGSVRSQTVSSVPRSYTFHVGLLADLKVTASVSDSEPDPGDTVTYTITASNKGPDKAANTKVKVDLPVGLSVAADTDVHESTGDYDRATGVWDVGDMAKPAAGETATKETLTLTVTVPTSATRGAALDTDAEIYATEDIGATTHRRELDPHTHDNDDTVTVTPPVVDNAAPYFYVIRDIAENSAAGTKVGSPIVASDPDTGDTLTYTLTGSDQFTFKKVTGGVQIVVASGADLNYEVVSSYNLELTVSDSKDPSGNADTAIDDTIPVLVKVTDVAETMTATLSVTPLNQTLNEEVTFTVTVADVPGDPSRLSYILVGNTPQNADPKLRSTTFQTATFTKSFDTAGNREYYVRLMLSDSQGSLIGTATSNTVSVRWLNDD